MAPYASSPKHRLRSGAAGGADDLSPYGTPPKQRMNSGYNYAGGPARNLNYNSYQPASPAKKREEDPNLYVIDVAGPREKLPRPPSSLSPETVYSDTPALPKEAPRYASPCKSNNKEISGDGEAAATKSASPQFMWTTTDSVIARSPEAAAASPFPLASICAPFADGADSGSLELATPAAGREGALRCPRCRCFANPFFRWCRRGPGLQHKTPNSFQCNMCLLQFDVPEGYLQGMDRPDADIHPELFNASVDIAASSNLDVDRPTAPAEPAVVFIVEASMEAKSSGLLRASLAAIEHAMDHADAQLRRRVCLITFDDALQFYSVSKTGRFRRTVVRRAADEDPFVPMAATSLFVDLRNELDRDDFRELLQVMQDESAPEELPSTPSSPGSPSSSPPSSPSRSPSRRGTPKLFRGNGAVGGDALRVAVDLLAGLGGGDVMIFHATNPSVSLGASLQSLPLEKPEIPQQAGFYHDTLARCRRGSVAVNVVTAPTESWAAHLDVETLQWLAWRTGGDTLHLPDFTPDKCEHQLGDHVHHWAGKMTGSAYGCVVRLRCSRGLACKSLMAPFPPAVTSADQSAFELPRLAADTSFAFELGVEPEAMDSEGDYAWYPRRDGKKVFYIQLATLYTNTAGQRLLRVHTSAISTVPSVRSMFQSVSVGPLMAFMVRRAAALALEDQGSRLLPRDVLLDFAIRVLVAHRRYCHRNVGAGKLGIDRRLKLLPLYILGARKLIYSAMCMGIDGKQQLRNLMRMPVHNLLAAIYPRIYPVEVGSPESKKESTKIKDEGTDADELPWPLAPLQECMTRGTAAAYVITNGMGAWFYRRGVNAIKTKVQEIGRRALGGVRDKLRPGAAADGADKENQNPVWQLEDPAGKAAEAAKSQELLAKAETMCDKLREELEPSSRSLQMTELTSLSTGEDKRERAWMASLFVEDEGHTEMSYVSWLEYLRLQVRAVFE